MIRVFLILSLILPAKSFPLAVLSFSTTFLMSLFITRSMALQRLVILGAVAGILGAASFIHMMAAGSFEEVVDLARLMPIAAFMLVGKRIEPHHIRFSLIAVLIANFLCIYLVANNLAQSFFSYLHARDLEESFGRHSGIFVNVATLGVFGLLSGLFFFNELGNKRRIWDGVFLLSSMFLMVLSGSKTAIILFAIFLFYKLLVSMVTLRANFITGSALLLIALGVFFAEQLAEQYYVLFKIFTIIEGGLGSASSLVGRLDIWSSYLRIFYNDASLVPFGAPVTLAEQYSTTFDSDPMWMMVRFGFLGALIWSVFWLRCLWVGRGHTVSLSVILICSLMVGVFTNFQLAILSLVLIRYFVYPPSGFEPSVDVGRPIDPPEAET